MHQRLQLEVDELKIQKQLSTQAYEADAQVDFNKILFVFINFIFIF
jgi:hypothetical protein